MRILSVAVAAALFGSMFAGADAASATPRFGIENQSAVEFIAKKHKKHKKVKKHHKKKHKHHAHKASSKVEKKADKKPEDKKADKKTR